MIIIPTILLGFITWDIHIQQQSDHSRAAASFDSVVRMPNVVRLKGQKVLY
jgi:hypothetical protein